MLPRATTDMSYSATTLRSTMYIALLVLFPGAADAQRAVLLPTEGTEALGGLRERVVTAFSSALREDGFTVSGPDSRALDVLECDSRACAATALSALGADFGVALAVWRRTRGGSELAVTLYLPDGTTRDLSSPLEGDGLVAAQAIAAEVAQAIRAYQPVPDAQASTGRETTRVAASNYVIGGAALALAVPALTLGFATVARRGDCVRTESGDCDDPRGVTREVSVGPRTVALLAGGGVMLAASVYVLGKRPIRVAITPTTTGVVVSTSGRF